MPSWNQTSRERTGLLQVVSPRDPGLGGWEDYNHGDKGLIPSPFSSLPVSL